MNILIPIAMFIFSLDGYNAIQHFKTWWKVRGFYHWEDLQNKRLSFYR